MSLDNLYNNLIAQKTLTLSLISLPAGLCRLYCTTKHDSLLFFCQKTVVNPAPAEHCHMQVFNLARGNVSVTIRDSELFPDPVPYLQVEKTAFLSSCMKTRPLTHFVRRGQSSPDLCRPALLQLKVSPSLTGPSQIRDGSAQPVQQDPAH